MNFGSLVFYYCDDESDVHVLFVQEGGLGSPLAGIGQVVTSSRSLGHLTLSLV